MRLASLGASSLGNPGPLLARFWTLLARFWTLLDPPGPLLDPPGPLLDPPPRLPRLPRRLKTQASQEAQDPGFPGFPETSRASWATLYITAPAGNPGLLFAIFLLSLRPEPDQIPSLLSLLRHFLALIPSPSDPSPRRRRQVTLRRQSRARSLTRLAESSPENHPFHCWSRPSALAGLKLRFLSEVVQKVVEFTPNYVTFRHFCVTFGQESWTRR